MCLLGIEPMAFVLQVQCSTSLTNGQSIFHSCQNQSRQRPEEDCVQIKTESKNGVDFQSRPRPEEGQV